MSRASWDKAVKRAYERSNASPSKVATSEPKRGKASKARIGGKDSGPSEHQSQVTVVTWWAHYCKTKGLDERLLFAIPNASRLMDGGRVYKWKEGLRAGVPDLMLARPLQAGCTMIWAGLFVEMKSRTGKTSEAQAGYIRLLRSSGYDVVVCWSADEAIRAITAYVERA